MRKNWYSYVTSHNLINRIYDMLDFFNCFKNIKNNEIITKKYIKNNLNDIAFIETLLKYFERKLSKNIKKVDLRCNLYDLINDLNYLKQYLDS